MSKHDSIEHLQQILMEGGSHVFDVAPKAIVNIVSSKAWERRLDENGVAFVSFEALVQAPYWHGLETSIDDLMAICRKNDKAQEAIRGAIGKAPDHVGKGHSSDNVTPMRGNNPTYALRRLKRDRPDLAERVVSGELSANAAAIEAGIRKPPKPRLTHCPHCGQEL